MEVALERDYFRYMAFTYDMLKYSMEGYGIGWYMPHYESMEDYRSNRRFHPQVGEAILRYQQRNAIDIVMGLNDLEARGNVREVLFTVAAATFREGNFVKEFFRFCVQIVAMGLEFIDRGEPWQLDLIVSHMDVIYKFFLSKRIMSLGGWNILDRYVVRSYMYEY